MSRGRSSRRAEIALLFGWNFAVVTAIFVGRTVRDVLFLTHESPARLPYLYIASPIVVTLVGLAYGRIADRIRRDRLVVATALAFAALAIATRFALGPRWLYYALYVGIECLATLTIMQFWIAAGERFAPRDAKRWFGVIAAGGTVANIVIGLALTGVVARIGAEGLLWIVAGALIAVAALSVAVARRPGAPAPSRPPARAPGSAPAATVAPAAPVAGTSHLRLLAPMIACGVVAVTLLDFQFKAIATAHYAGDRVQMVEFFAVLSAATGVASLVIQLTLTGRLLGRFGVAGALLALPTTLSLGAAALLLVPSLVAATVSKAADQTLRYTVHDAGMQLVYLPVPRAVRGRKKAMLDGVVRPATEASVGAALLGYRAVAGALAPLAAIALAAAAIWIALVARMRGAYAGALAEALRRRRVAADGVDDGARRARRRRRCARRSRRPTARRCCARSTSRAWCRRRCSPTWRRSRRTPIRRSARPRWRCSRPRRAPRRRRRSSPRSPTPIPRRGGGGRGGAAQLPRVRPLLADADPAVAAAAAGALHRLGDAAARADAVARIAALIADPAPAARRAGIEAAARRADPAWIAPLVARLADRRDRARAARASARSARPRWAAVLPHLDATPDDGAREATRAGRARCSPPPRRPASRSRPRTSRGSSRRRAASWRSRSPRWRPPTGSGATSPRSRPTARARRCRSRPPRSRGRRR